MGKKDYNSNTFRNKDIERISELQRNITNGPGDGKKKHYVGYKPLQPYNQTSINSDSSLKDRVLHKIQSDQNKQDSIAHKKLDLNTNFPKVSQDVSKYGKLSNYKTIGRDTVTGDFMIQRKGKADKFILKRREVVKNNEVKTTAFNPKMTSVNGSIRRENFIYKENNPPKKKPNYGDNLNM